MGGACWAGENTVEGPPFSVGCVDRRIREGDLAGSQDQQGGELLPEDDLEPCQPLGAAPTRAFGLPVGRCPDGHVCPIGRAGRGVPLGRMP
jgi:hypothetical protein